MDLQENVELAPFTTLRIGGPARFFAAAHNEQELVAAVSFAREQRLPLFVLGGGSNLVVPDAGYPGVVLQAVLGGEIAMRPGRADGEGRFVYCDVPAGVVWDDLVDQVCAAGLTGLECLAGIPGLTGGSPVQNIGSYGQEVSQTITSVRVFDREQLAFRELTNAECGFAYRSSIFNSSARGRYVITRVSFRLESGTPPRLRYPELERHFAGQSAPGPVDVAQAVRGIRAGKGMYLDPRQPSPDHRSAGSFFKNPVVPVALLDGVAGAFAVSMDAVPHWPAGDGAVKLSAAWLIERAGFPRGFLPDPASNVGISSRHTLALINRTGAASCAELLALRDQIIATVEQRCGVLLQQEPVVLNV